MTAKPTQQKSWHRRRYVAGGGATPGKRGLRRARHVSEVKARSNGGIEIEIRIRNDIQDRNDFREQVDGSVGQ